MRSAYADRIRTAEIEDHFLPMSEKVHRRNIGSLFVRVWTGDCPLEVINGSLAVFGKCLQPNFVLEYVCALGQVLSIFCRKLNAKAHGTLAHGM
jgi:hypothetical protein